MKFENACPTENEIYTYAKYVVLAAKMEKEAPIISLIYLERLMLKTGVMLNHWNWRRLVLITLIEAGKVWDDDTLENKHLPRVMPDLTLLEINELEKTLLELLQYELYIKGSEYAKYFFILKTF